MKIDQMKYSQEKGWETIRTEGFKPKEANLVLVFGGRPLLSSQTIYATIRDMYPQAELLFNSTAGEIIDIQVNDDSISLTAIKFEKTPIKTATVAIDNPHESYAIGKYLGELLPKEALKSVLVISDGLRTNGSDLVLGLQDALPKNVTITGGLAGDGAHFGHTLVGLNEQPSAGKIVAVGFYGEAISITYGSVGGWSPFGPERLVTRSEANVLYELDNRPALDIYKQYLGEYADELPGSGLLFPLSMRTNGPGSVVVRTILAVSETDKSLTFAGNMPQGAYARLMKANFERLIEGASSAAQNSLEKGMKQEPDLAVLISCVGRKLVLDQRIEEEIEVVRAVYGARTAITGFYSYGEICPGQNFMKCELHNQTMTITTFTEK